MGRTLILGGTAWLGRELARQAVARGDDVTCLARGDSGPVPDGARLVGADRDALGAYDGLRGQSWDAVVDVSWQPSQVASALDALADAAAHWTYVSSVSVYARDDLPGADESAERVPPLAAGEADLSTYAEAKVRCEDLVTASCADRALLARAGLIVGPGDPTDRFGYWVGRLALAGDGPVLVPAEPRPPVQVIDVRDLAAWILATAPGAVIGPRNAVGPVQAFTDVLAAAEPIAGFTGRVVPATAEWLVEQGVSPWSGPRSLPLWLPMPEHAGTMARSRDAAVRDGLAGRPLAATLVDTLADERSRGLARDRRAGLGRDEELALIRGLS